MRVKMQRVYIWECPKCHDQYRDNFDCIDPPNCPYCEDYGTDVIDMSHNRPDWNIIQLHIKAMNQHLGEIEKEIEKLQ